MIGARLDVPVVPVRLDGLDKVLDPHWKWPKRGPVARVLRRAAAAQRATTTQALAKQVEDAVRALEWSGTGHPGCLACTRSAECRQTGAAWQALSVPSAV